MRHPMEGTDDMNMNISTDSEINVRLIDLSGMLTFFQPKASYAANPSDLLY